MEPLSRAFALPPPFISGYVQPLPPRGQLGSVGHIHHSAVSGGCCGIGCDIAVACDLATAQGPLRKAAVHRATAATGICQ